MPLTVFWAVILAAVLHAVWNAMVKSEKKLAAINSAYDKIEKMKS